MLWQDPLISPLHFIIHPALLLKAQSHLHPNERLFPPASALPLDPGEKSAARAPGTGSEQLQGLGWKNRESNPCLTGCPDGQQGDRGEGEWCFLPSFIACSAGRKSISGILSLEAEAQESLPRCSRGSALIPPSCTALPCPVETEIREKQANAYSPGTVILILAAVSLWCKA